MPYRIFLRAVPLPFAFAALLAPAPLAFIPVPAQARDVVSGWDEAGLRLLEDLQGVGEQMASLALARWIVASRDDAVTAGVLPVPEQIRAKLRGHVPDALLEKARYRVGTGHEFSLHTNAFQRGTAAAITLGDVVLFRSEADAISDTKLWAHELQHVQQYERWGVEGFAQRYTRDYRAVEAEAEQGALRVTSSRADAG
jgi:hypothetical protein